MFLFTFSCNNDQISDANKLSENTEFITSNNKHSEDIPQVYQDLLDNIGDVHNQSMEYAFNKFKSEQTFLNHSSSEYNSILQNTVKDFYTNYLTLKGESIDADKTLDFIQNIGNYPTDNISTTLSQAIEFQSNTMKMSTSPAEFQVLALDQLASTLPLLDEKEQIVFTAFTSVAIASFNYWTNNMDKWENEYSTQTQQAITSDKKKTIPGTGRADAQGAITGGINGAISGTVVGTPVGGLVAGIFGAAVGASISSLAHIVTHWPKK